MQAQWLSHDKNYWRKVNYFDGTAIPLVSSDIIQGFDDSIKDIAENRHKHTLPVLVMMGGKDKIIDNAGGLEFHS